MDDLCELIVICDSCGTRLPGLLSTCTDPDCAAEWIAAQMREEQRIEATS